MVVKYVIVLTLGLIFSSLNVYFRDLAHILGVGMMVWFYLTLLVFPVEMISKQYLKYFFINPIITATLAYIGILFYGKAHDIFLLIMILLVSVLVLIFSYEIFRKLQKNFAEEV